MTTLMDARFEALRFLGFEGSISDMLLAWLIAGGPGSGGGGYVQNRVDNDANGRLTSAGTLDMGADSDQFILSLWLQAVPTLLNDNCVFELTAPGGSKVRLRWSTGAVAVTNLELNIGNSGISDILAGVSTSTFDRTLEHHILIARSGTTLNFYVDGVLETFNAAPTAATVPFSTVVNGGILCYANSAGAAGYIIGDLYFAAGQYLDMDTPANLARFINGDGNPVNLGSTGNSPTGSSPQIYFGNPNVAADWDAGTNLGTTGNYALLGGPFIDIIPPPILDYNPNYVMPVNSYLTTAITPNNQLTLCVWVDLPVAGNRTMLAVQGTSTSSRMISASLERWNYVPHAPNAGGQTDQNAFVPGLQLFTCIWDATETGLDRVRFYFNGLPAVMATAAGGSTMPSGTLTLLADSGGGLLFQTDRMADMWISNLPIDFDDPLVVAKFIDGSGNPVPLGANGELPLGGPPLVFMGSDMVAADWNAGENRGTLANFTKFGGNFTDV